MICNKRKVLKFYKKKMSRPSKKSNLKYLIIMMRMNMMKNILKEVSIDMMK